MFVDTWPGHGEHAISLAGVHERHDGGLIEGEGERREVGEVHFDNVSTF